MGTKPNLKIFNTKEDIWVLVKVQHFKKVAENTKKEKKEKISIFIALQFFLFLGITK